ncbi:hypothetical protein JW968_03515 [Candidatus Woesearchaeota archaeon]|nr:hypothetical protein [Candidatus Woesearchaeota archaeon]
MSQRIDWRYLGHVNRPNVIWYKGLFDLAGMIQLIQSWLEENQYAYQEKKYKHKVPTPKGVEEDYHAFGRRRMDTYVAFEIHVQFKAWDMQDVEVIKDGRKVKMQKGRIRIEMWCVLELDWKSAFETSKFMEKVRNFYNEFIVKKEIDTIWGDYIYYIMLKLHGEIKKFLNMEASSNIYITRW